MTLRRILFAGDLHGDARTWRMLWEEVARVQAQALFVLGDFGYGWPGGNGPETYPRVEGIPVYFIDGNHDNFDALWKDADPALLEFQEVAPGLFYVPRGTTWSWGGKSFLAMGGAVSIDRAYREHHERAAGMRVWWPQEQITAANVERVAAADVDVLLCHDLPATAFDAWVESEGGTANFDHKMDEASTKNREYLDEVWRRVHPPLTLHGHWHRPHRTEMEGRVVMGLADLPPFNTYLMDLEAT